MKPSYHAVLTTRDAVPVVWNFASRNIPRFSSLTTLEFIQHLATRVPVVAAGVTPSYSNMAFQLLGYIIERRTGASFAKVVQERLLNPLRMNETTVFAPKNSTMGVIPVNETASGWSARTPGSEA